MPTNGCFAPEAAIPRVSALHPTKRKLAHEARPNWRQGLAAKMKAKALYHFTAQRALERTISTLPHPVNSDHLQTAETILRSAMRASETRPYSNEWRLWNFKFCLGNGWRSNYREANRVLIV